MSSNDESEFIATCCADIYNHPLILKLLDGVLHPGGLALSAHLADKMGINRNSTVLDMACGDGKTVVFLSTKYGCKITGIDAGEKMIGRGKVLAERAGVTGKVNFYQNIVGKLPFENGYFDFAISECSFCTFQNKERAAVEVHRVLKPEGILGITDVTLRKRDSLDSELQSLLGRVLCVADAVSKEAYIEIFEEAGFRLLESTTYSDLFDEMVKRVISNAKMLQGTSSTFSKKIIVSDDLKKAIRLARLVEGEIEKGNLGYELFILKK